MSILVIGAIYAGVMAYLWLTNAPAIAFTVATGAMTLTVAVAALTGFSGAGRS